MLFHWLLRLSNIVSSGAQQTFPSACQRFWQWSFGKTILGIRTPIWDLLVDKLCDAYQRALNHACFLLEIKRGIQPSTFNHYFNANLQNKHNDRLLKNLKPVSEKITFNSGKGSEYSGDYIAVSRLKGHAVDKDNAQQVREDILDALVHFFQNTIHLAPVKVSPCLRDTGMLSKSLEGKPVAPYETCNLMFRSIQSDFYFSSVSNLHHFLGFIGAYYQSHWC